MRKSRRSKRFLETRNEQHPTNLAALRGARFVVSSEPKAGQSWDETKIKILTGGDPIRARFMRCDEFEFIPQFKLLVHGNNKPSLRRVDEAIRRRFHLVPFTVKISPEERILDLDKKLKVEWPAILRWAIDGYREWERQRLNPPQVVKDATAEYLRAEDSIR